jgi:glucose/arabinose dehydrogenase
MKYRYFNLLIICLIALSCTDSGDESGSSGVDQQGMFTLVNAFPNISFDRPLDIQDAGDGTGRLFVAEQRGVIRVIEKDADTGETKTKAFLDITDRVYFDQNQRGILGFTFHRNYEINGFFYVFYIAEKPQRTVISRFTVSSADQDQADPGSELILFELNHDPRVEFGTCHCGGRMSMGPDGYLYIALGVSGSASNSQDTANLFGSILRIDVDNPQNGLNYSIPPGNPFFSNNEGKREEIFAYGLRNPFRFSFDSETGLLWVGDVGEHRFEEVDIIESGGNYGWDIMEGTSCFNPEFRCDMTGLQLPTWTYFRDEGSTIIGGIVYRGSELPELFGSYIYADFGSGRVWALSVDENNQPTNNVELLHFDPFRIVSFGVDEDSELLICSFDGRIYRLARSEN